MGIGRACVFEAPLIPFLGLFHGQALASQAVSLDSGATVLVAGLEGIDGKSLQDAAQKILQDLKDPAAVLLGSAANGRVSLVAALSPAVRLTVGVT